MLSTEDEGAGIIPTRFVGVPRLEDTRRVVDVDILPAILGIGCSSIRAVLLSELAVSGRDAEEARGLLSTGFGVPLA